MTSSAELDADIERVERRLVAREARVREGIRVTQRRLHRAALPARWLLPLAGAAAAALAWRLLSHRKPALPHADSGPVMSPHIGPVLMGVAPTVLRLLVRALVRNSSTAEATHLR